MTELAQCSHRLPWETALHAQHLYAIYRAVYPARQLDGFLNVESETRRCRVDLQVNLGLPITAHSTENHRGPPLAQRHRGDQGVQRAFGRSKRVGSSGVEREVRAAILKHDASIVHNDAAAEAHVITLDERNNIAFPIRRTEVNGIAAETTGSDRRSRSGRVNERRRIEAHVSRVGKISVAVSKSQLLRLDLHVNCIRR